MYCVGQLWEEWDLNWGLEFKDYHGLKSVNDIKFLSSSTLLSLKLTNLQLKNFYKTVNHVFPILQDNICFILISMIMMLDTSNLTEDDTLTSDGSSPVGSSEYTASSSNNFHNMAGNHATGMYDNAASLDPGLQKKKPNIHSRFEEINVLQKQYIHLLRRYCLFIDNPELRKLGDIVGLEKAMYSFKQLAHYIPLLMN